MEKGLLYRYFSGEANPAEEKEIIDWAEASSENYRMYLREREFWNAVVVNSTGILSMEIAGTEKRPVKIKIRQLTAVAAAVVLSIFFLYPFIHPDKHNEKWQSVWAPPGQRTRIVLDDSTVVWLNSQSTLTFPSAFNADIRAVKLEGEGYFEVKKDRKKTFVVRTSHYDISVLGTNFNVFAYENKAAFETSLLDGSVEISYKDKDIPAVRLSPNERVTAIDGRLVKSVIDNFDHFRWREGLICFDGEPFGSMMEKFSLYFDISIKIENPALLEYCPTGKFRHSDGIDHALKVLQRDLRFTYNRNHENNEIVIR
jgi:ferric-dicitrate binding protein FerR (iron transport regulator)